MMDFSKLLYHMEGLYKAMQLALLTKAFLTYDHNRN
jgi:hypothetical protein